MKATPETMLYSVHILNTGCLTKYSNDTSEKLFSTKLSHAAASTAFNNINNNNKVLFIINKHNNNKYLFIISLIVVPFVMDPPDTLEKVSTAFSNPN